MSHGSDDSDNYWPGYVDALTSMVQVLAFVMMMLAMAVFVLSQSVSKNAVEAIAKAVDADVKPNSDLKQLTQAVMQKLENLRGASADSPAAGSKAAAPADQSAQSDEKVVGMRINAGRAQPRPAVDAPPDAPRIAIDFEGNGFRIDDARGQIIGKFIGDNQVAEKSKAIILNAYAFTGEGAISEARRLAYYRAMTARKRMVDAKVQAETIRINVKDTADKSKGQTLEVIVAGNPRN